MNPSPDPLVHALLHAPASVGIVGTGSQAAAVRAHLAEWLRLRLDGFPGASSSEIPADRAHYLVCASPPEAARATLLLRGIPAERITLCHDLIHRLPKCAAGWLRAELTLDPLDAEGRIVVGDGGTPRLAQLLRSADVLLRELFNLQVFWSPEQLRLIESFSSVYLTLRRQWSEFDGAPRRRLLFPSPGRCGGVSLTQALGKLHPLRLRVDHEGNANLIYRLLAYHRRGELGETVLAAFLAQMLEDYDCLGGNPFCFLVPYLKHVPWFECHLLKVERPLPELRESIIDRNFHYTSADFVAERITGAAWGDMSAEEWNQLELPSKVDWYILKVGAEIMRGAAACRSFVRTPLRDVHTGLNAVLGALQWPVLAAMPHVNTIPKDRVYSLEERIALFREEHAKL